MHSLQTIFLAIVLSLMIVDAGKTQPIQGNSGGSVDSKDCGFIGVSPNHVMNISQRIDYMRLTVQADGGQPTLLIIESDTGQRFCALGDRSSGLLPEISGFWEPGKYEVYVGDRTGNQYPFTLSISTNR
ncbi:MAG TPA: hypothetical protein ACFCUY_09250 [Xenococcaceae cyanobacterium]